MFSKQTKNAIFKLEIVPRLRAKEYLWTSEMRVHVLVMINDIDINCEKRFYILINGNILQAILMFNPGK